jgi:LPXTG-motif cell wall-anchored protein
MQEIEAPAGYRLDNTKYWFCFCDDASDHCDVCNEVMKGVDALRIPLDEIKKINATNVLMGDILPTTGSFGQPIWILSGLGIMLTSLVFGYILRRKRERRGDG